MERKIIPTGEKPSIIVRSIPGDLRVIGCTQQEIRAKTDGDVLDLIPGETGATVSCDGDLILIIPIDSNLMIELVEDDASLRDLTGIIEIGKVLGNISLRHIGEVTIKEVGDEFIVRHGAGPIQVNNIGSDASIQDVVGDIVLGNVGEDLHLRGVSGNLTATVYEDAILYIEPEPGTEIHVNAGEDILLRLPKDPDVEMNLTCGSDNSIQIELPGVSMEAGSSRLLTLGSGATKIYLTAGDDILVTHRADEWESRMDFDVDFDMGAMGKGYRDIPENLAERITHQAEVATRHAELVHEKAAVAMRRAERKMEAAARRAKQKIRRSGWHVQYPTDNWSFPQGMGTPIKEPVTDEERLTILRMLQEKKITAEEAEKLLAALE